MPWHQDTIARAVLSMGAFKKKMDASLVRYDRFYHISVKTNATLQLYITKIIYAHGIQLT